LAEKIFLSADVLKVNLACAQNVYNAFPNAKRVKLMLLLASNVLQSEKRHLSVSAPLVTLKMIVKIVHYAPKSVELAPKQRIIA
jgi:hypothetical protein